jgi:cytochrome P450
MLSNNVAVRASGSSNARDAAAAQEQLTRYMDGLVARKEQQPGKDLISEVVQSQLKSGKVTREQLVAHAFLLLVAGGWFGSSVSHLGWCCSRMVPAGWLSLSSAVSETLANTTARKLRCPCIRHRRHQDSCGPQHAALLVLMSKCLLPAGNATVASMINLGVITLLRHPPFPVHSLCAQVAALLVKQNCNFAVLSRTTAGITSNDRQQGLLATTR